MSEPVDVAGLCGRVFDPDLGHTERRLAAVELVEKCGLRSLRDLLELVYGTGEPVPPEGFDACADAFDDVLDLRALERA